MLGIATARSLRKPRRSGANAVQSPGHLSTGQHRETRFDAWSATLPRQIQAGNLRTADGSCGNNETSSIGRKFESSPGAPANVRPSRPQRAADADPTLGSSANRSLPPQIALIRLQ
jgi:hypothetical protein